MPLLWFLLRSQLREMFSDHCRQQRCRGGAMHYRIYISIAGHLMRAWSFRQGKAQAAPAVYLPYFPFPDSPFNLQVAWNIWPHKLAWIWCFEFECRFSTHPHVWCFFGSLIMTSWACIEYFLFSRLRGLERVSEFEFRSWWWWLTCTILELMVLGLSLNVTCFVCLVYEAFKARAPGVGTEDLVRLLMVEVMCIWADRIRCPNKSLLKDQNYGMRVYVIRFVFSCFLQLVWIGFKVTQRSLVRCH